MRHVHEVSPAWRGAPWDRRVTGDWADAPDPDPESSRAWLPLALSVVLGLALGVTMVAGLARQDRLRFDALMVAVRAGA